MLAPASVFVAALGDDARRLRPEVLAYAAGPTDAREVGVGTGVFEVAGTPLGWLARAASLVLGRDLLVTRYERDVPFELVNRHGVLPSGRPTLHATREFRFAGGTQVFDDVLLLADRPGMLVNQLGRGRRLEVLLTCAVSSSGHLVLREHAARLRIGRRTRVRIPRRLAPRIRLDEGFDDATRRHTIDVRVALPIVGTVMAYRGSFEYAYERRERSWEDRVSSPDRRAPTQTAARCVVACAT